MVSERDADFAFLAWMCALTGAYCALIFWGARVGLSGPPMLAPLCVAILWAAAFSPFLVPEHWRNNNRGRAAIGLIILLLFSGPLLSYWGSSPLFSLYVLIAVFGVARAWKRFRPMPMQIAALVILPPLTAAYLVTTMQSLRGGVNIFGPELASLGWYISDAYWHSTLARLAQVQGAITLGLDGLDFRQRYHAASHVWFGGLAEAGGSTPLFSYPLGFMVIVLPGLLLAGGVCIIDACRSAEMWVRILVLMVLVLLLERLSLPRFYSSESYGVSIVALTLALPLLFALRARGEENALAAYLPWLIAVALAVPFTLIKVSTGFIWATLVAHRALRTWRLQMSGVVVILSLAVVLPYPLSISILEWGRLIEVLVGESGPTSSARPIALFHFFKDQPTFTLFALLPIGVLLLSRLGYGIRANWQERPSAGAAKTYLETLCVMAGIGLAGTALYLGGHDSLFFLAPVQWVGLLFLVALAEPPRILGPKQDAQTPRQLIRVGLTSVSGLLLIGVIVFKVEFNLNRTIDTTRSMIAVLKPGDPLGHSPDREVLFAWVRNLFDSSLFDEKFREALAGSPGGRLERIAADLLGGNRRGAAAFVTLEQQAAWEDRFEMLPVPDGWLRRNCAEPLFVQALIGVPLLQGVPPFWHRCPDSVFHFGHDLVWRQLITRNLDDPSLCEIARRKGIGRVLVLGNLEIRDRNRVLSCS